MTEYYIVREYNKEGETYRYHLQSHSELTKDAKVVSKWYAYPKKTTAESLAKRLQKADKTGHLFECVSCSSQGIEVK